MAGGAYDPESGSYTVGIDTPGEHVVRVEFFTGREDDRFAQRLQLALPPSGPTRVSILVPDVDIDTTLTQGAVTALRQEAGSTRIEGQLDPGGTVPGYEGVDLTLPQLRDDHRPEM